MQLRLKNLEQMSVNDAVNASKTFELADVHRHWYSYLKKSYNNDKYEKFLVLKVTATESFILSF